MREIVSIYVYMYICRRGRKGNILIVSWNTKLKHKIVGGGGGTCKTHEFFNSFKTSHSYTHIFSEFIFYFLLLENRKSRKPLCSIIAPQLMILLVSIPKTKTLYIIFRYVGSDQIKHFQICSMVHLDPFSSLYL